MSRNFDLTIRVKGIAQNKISDFLKQHFGDLDVVSEGIDGIYAATGIVTLCGGQSDCEAHKELSEYFKGINPNALIQSRWTNLEDLPFDEYGDDFEGEGDE